MGIQRTIKITQQSDGVKKPKEPPKVLEMMSTKSAALMKESKQGAPAAGEGLKMKREIGLLSGIGLVVGSMIGSGIFVAPGGVLKRSGSVGLSLVLWAACGLLSIFGSLSYAELGTLIPKSGGEYAYFLDGFGSLHPFWGPLLAFLYSWLMMLLVKPASFSLGCLSIAKYTVGPILDALDKEPTGADEEMLSKLVALLFLCFTIGINSYSVKGTLWLTNIFTVAKLVAIGILVGIGVYQLAMGNTRYLAEGFDGSATDSGRVALAFYGALWSYTGWNNLNFVTEELKNPYVNLPRALLIGIPLMTACCLAVNVAYLTVLSPQEMISSSAVAVDLGNAFLGPVSFIIPVTVVMSILGSNISSGFSAGRICFATAREGHVMEVLSYVHVDYLTPMPALLFLGGISVIMILVQDVAQLIDLFAFIHWIFHVLAMILILVLRRIRPDAPRPYKVSLLLPIVTMIVGSYLVVAPIIYDPDIQYLYILLVLMVGFVVYIPFIYYKFSLPHLEKITRVIQLILNIAPSAKFEQGSMD